MFSNELELNDAAVSAVRAAEVVFVYSDFIDFFFDQVLPLVERSVVLITNGGDHEVGEKYRSRIETGKLRHWFAQNATIAHPRITAIPIGLANAHWPHGNLAAVVEVASRSIPRRSGAYVNFDVGTNPAVRAPLLRALRKNPFAVMGRPRSASAILLNLARTLAGRTGVPRQGKPLPYTRYLSELASWEFCISPPGNGIDCHRTWEAMYLGVTPVVSKAPAGLLDRLPSILAEDLGMVSERMLREKAGARTEPLEYERLTISYWRERIRAEVKGLTCVPCARV